MEIVLQKLVMIIMGLMIIGGFITFLSSIVGDSHSEITHQNYAIGSEIIEISALNSHSTDANFKFWTYTSNPIFISCDLGNTKYLLHLDKINKPISNSENDSILTDQEGNSIENDLSARVSRMADGRNIIEINFDDVSCSSENYTVDPNFFIIDHRGFLFRLNHKQN